MGFAESAAFSRIGRLISPGAVILTNHNRLPLLRLWTERPVYDAALIDYPHGSPHARWMLELSLNHLRELYRDDVPRLYFVYRFPAVSHNELFAGDPQLRLLLFGKMDHSESDSNQGAEIIREAARTGTSERSFCPIVAVVDDMLCFEMNRLMPVLRDRLAHFAFPTPREFGPTR